MLHMRKIHCCFVAALCCLSQAYGQYKFDQPILISKEQGLPTNEIRSIRKGKDGFIWMGTAEGLCRFDGQQATLFRLTDDKTAATFGNMVSAVLPIDDEVWMGTDQGVAIMNTKTQKLRYYQLEENGKSDSVVRRFNQSVVVLYQDRQGEIWIRSEEHTSELQSQSNLVCRLLLE